MAIGRLSDIEPKHWYELAIQLDQNSAVDEAFMSSYCSPATLIFSSTPQNAGTVFSIVNPSRFAHVNPTPGKPVPMDIDAAKRKMDFALQCQRCRQMGHFARDCDQKFDIRHMTTDKIQTVLEDMVAAKDAVTETPAELPAEESEETDQDFVHRNQ